MITNTKTLQKDAKRHGTRLVKIFDMIRKNKTTEIEYIRIFDKFTKYFNDLEIFNEDLMNFLKEPDTTQFELLFILCILEFYFSIKFIFVNEEDAKLILLNNEKYNELRTVFDNATYKEIIVLNVDNKNIIKTIEVNDKSNGIEKIDQLLKDYTPSFPVGIFEPVEEEENELQDNSIDEQLDESGEISKTKNRTLLAISNPSINTQVNALPNNESKQSKKLSFTGSVLKPKKKDGEKTTLSIIPEETPSAALSAINTTTTKKQNNTPPPSSGETIEQQQKSSTKSAAKQKKSKGQPPPSTDIEEQQKSSTKSSAKSGSKSKKAAAATIEPPDEKPPVEPPLDEQTAKYKATVEKLLSTIDTPKLSKSKKSS